MPSLVAAANLAECQCLDIFILYKVSQICFIYLSYVNACYHQYQMQREVILTWLVYANTLFMSKQVSIVETQRLNTISFNRTVSLYAAVERCLLLNSELQDTARWTYYELWKQRSYSQRFRFKFRNTSRILSKQVDCKVARADVWPPYNVITWL